MNIFAVIVATGIYFAFGRPLIQKDIETAAKTEVSSAIKSYDSTNTKKLDEITLDYTTKINNIKVTYDSKLDRMSDNIRLLVIYTKLENKEAYEKAKELSKD